MSYAFDATQGLILVSAELYGPEGSAVVSLAVDTGATSTTINVAPLVAIGCDPALSPDRVQVPAGSGVEYAPRVTLARLEALGLGRAGFGVLAHTLPPSAGIDGCLDWTSFAVRNWPLTSGAAN